LCKIKICGSEGVNGGKFYYLISEGKENGRRSLDRKEKKSRMSRREKYRYVR
jgi:hypothetical protein